MPLDKATRKLLPDPATKVEGWGDYQTALSDIRALFPGCTLYEANLVAYLVHSDTFSTIDQSVFQVSTNVYNDGEDKWDEFQEENAVWTGGPGHIGWGEFESGTDSNIPYPLREPAPGDLILVRFAGHGRAIGVVFRNDYSDELSSKARLHVVWLNRCTVPNLLDGSRTHGFSRAHGIRDQFFANDAYRPTRALLDRLGNGGKAGPVEVDGLTREAVLRVIREFDQLGRDEFLTKYGYSKTRSHWLVHDDDRYDMKAVWAAAHLEPDAKLPAGMPAGKDHTDKAKSELKILGFTIENDRGTASEASDTAEVVAPLNQILYGPPGTGKTFRTTNLAVSIVDGDGTDGERDAKRLDEIRFNPTTNNGNVAFVTFHQNFAYEDFVEGIRPVLDKADLRYELRDGIFKRIAKAAQSRPGERFVLIIDEINRGNIAKIFGELITLIEDSRRSGQHDGTFATLPYSQQPFSVPSNLYLIGTMNTADRSIQLLDTALRRRFTFRECMPEPDHDQIHTNIDGVNCRDLLRSINERIALLLDREHQIGHTYFLNVDSLDKLASVFRDSVFPLLQEYFFDDWAKIRAVLANNAFVVESTPKLPVPAQDFVDEDRKVYDRLADDDERWRSAKEYEAIYSPKQERTNDE